MASAIGLVVSCASSGAGVKIAVAGREVVAAPTATRSNAGLTGGKPSADEQPDRGGRDGRHRHGGRAAGSEIRGTDHAVITSPAAPPAPPQHHAPEQQLLVTVYGVGYKLAGG